jgi:Uma2 family endonuclease
LDLMPTLVLDPAPLMLTQLLEERARLDLDRRDEVWDGVLHVIPPPSHAHELLATRLVRLLGPLADDAGLELTGGVGIGTGPQDYRVPDLALHRPGAPQQWHPTAALVLEILSPGDETWQKLPFYAAHHIDELVVIDPEAREVRWSVLRAEGAYEPTDHSPLLDVSVNTLAAQIVWP